jgi:CDP-diglyceride synthetase
MSRLGPSARLRERVAQGFTTVEDVLYVGLGVILAVAGVALLGNAAVHFARSLIGGAIPATVVTVLDQLLLTLMIVEILYTVQVSFREHVVVPEPFVLVALIAAVRRILVVTAEFGSLLEQGEGMFRNAMIELALLTVMAGVLVGCLVGLRKRDKDAAVAERA